jgi:hypothetical protein
MDHMQTETPFLKFWRRANEGRADRGMAELNFGEARYHYRQNEIDLLDLTEEYRGAIFRTDRDSISLLRGLVQSQAYVCGHDADRYAANLHKNANRVSA